MVLAGGIGDCSGDIAKEPTMTSDGVRDREYGQWGGPSSIVMVA
jgi:hypothetical protein